ncbi:hypothetical protein DRO58_08580, partial [Candidatus Bathyarchaeota archaeon]
IKTLGLGPPHAFRAMCQSFYARIFRNPFTLKQFMGIENLETVGRYVKDYWRDYADKILGS